jgi:hypothetical protein
MTQISVILWQALHAELGVEVATNDPELFKQRAYKVRAQEPDLQTLSLRSCPTDPEGKVWITHQGQTEGQTRAKPHPEPQEAADGS